MDIASIAGTQTVQAIALTSAVVSDAAMRTIERPERFIVPDVTG
ncbi:MAG: hypothetical protein SYR96_07350 [Actinomycetota bacterium]|nr:hypothetical protein [Actinomycetota bacterium]